MAAEGEAFPNMFLSGGGICLQLCAGMINMVNIPECS
jgi:hypothetical protein